MTQTRHDAPLDCEAFLDRLDAWLAQALDAEFAVAMQAHHAHCAACRMETRLAQTIDSTLHALPAHELPGLATAQRPTPLWRARLARLLELWSQPLVYAPALALVAALALVLLRPDSAPSADTITVDGVTYSQAEVLRAAADLELALRYLDKYGSFPSRLVHANGQAQALPVGDASEQPAI